MQVNDNEVEGPLPIQAGPGPIEGVEPEAPENAQDEGNWNPIEWDRAVDELTWERLLGLDGSLVRCKRISLGTSKCTNK